MDETISSLTSAISERSSNSAHTCFDASMYFLPYTPTYSNGTPRAVTAEPRLPRSEGCAQRRKQPSTQAKVLGGTRVLTHLRERVLVEELLQRRDGGEAAAVAREAALRSTAQSRARPSVLQRSGIREPTDSLTERLPAWVSTVRPTAHTPIVRYPPYAAVPPVPSMLRSAGTP
jgi:hypothetical protein